MEDNNTGKGNSELNKVIESFLNKYGGEKYKKVSLDVLKNDISEELDKIISSSTGSIKLVTSKFKKKLLNKRSKEDFFMYISETYFTSVFGE